MKMNIKELNIYTKNEVLNYHFDSRITFIYGNIGVGKTTMLSIVLYCLGGDLVETPAVKDQFVSAGLSVELNAGIYIFRRQYKSPRIFIKGLCGEIYNIDKKNISDFLYERSNLHSIYYERKGVDTPNQLTFKNYLWYVYLKQADSDSDFFYLGKTTNEFYQTASMNTLASLLGKSSFMDATHKKEISEKKKAFRKYGHGVVALDYVINEEFLKYILSEYDYMIQEDLKRREDKKTANLNFDNKLRTIKRMVSNYNKFFQEYYQLKKQVISYSRKQANSNDLNLQKNLEDLGEIFKDCLIAVKFPGISKTDRVFYEEKSLNPTIVNEYTDARYNYDLLGSGGKKTLFKICFLLAVHIKAEQINLYENRLPSIIIIDTPMKNISEREDQELFDNFYKYIIALSKTHLISTQMIIIDKEKNNIIENEQINIILITKEHPLFPDYVDSGSWRKI